MDRRGATSGSLIVTALIEIPLQRFLYHFRPLPWREEIRLKFGPKDDQRKVVMAQSMVDVSGLPVTVPDARRILDQIPEAIFWRMWVLYRGSLPEDRYYTHIGLYQAPDGMTHNSTLRDEGPPAGVVPDTGDSRNEHPREGQTDDAISRQLFQAAKREGKLVPAGEAGGHA